MHSKEKGQKKLLHLQIPLPKDDSIASASTSQIQAKFLTGRHRFKFLAPKA
jgi:hypothetical protein